MKIVPSNWLRTSALKVCEISSRKRMTHSFFARTCSVGALLAAASLAVVGGRQALAQAPVRVYAAEGPGPALHEAAAVFSADEAVRVVDGPPSEWIERAAADADVVCSSANFMMSRFLSSAALRVDPSTVKVLYMRSSAILVRPGNPKRIEDFPDLLRPGVRVMVVTGSGQTGLWEDMAGRKGDVQTVRKLRQNIAFYAAHSTEAIRLWRDKKDIDAWLTWDIWHTPLRTEAKLIQVSKDYGIFRQCSVALTSRGRDKPLAARFMEFLASPEGARVFASWGWMTPPADSGPVAVLHDVAVVCGVDRNTWTNHVGLGLARVKRLVEDYESIGVSGHELHISVVLHGEAAYWLLKDGPYRAFTRTEEGNPNRPLVEKLLGSGVSVELCGLQMKERGWSKDDLLQGITIVAGAYQRIVDFQLRGYAYIPF